MEERKLVSDHNQSHVAQQSRRDRLRIYHLPNNLERFPGFPDMNSHDQLPNVRCSNSSCEPVVLSSGMIDFAANSMDQPDPPGSSNWRSLGGAQRSSDWMVNCSSGWLGGTGQGNDQNHPSFLSNSMMNSVSGSMHCDNKSSNYDQEMQSLSDSPNQSQGVPFACAFQSSLEDVVTIASSGGSWPAGGNELPLLPSYGSQMFNDNASGWSNRAVHGYPHQHGGEFSNVMSDRRTQGLSLTLSSNPLPQQHVFQFGEGYMSGELPLRDAQLLKDRQDFNDLDSRCSITPKPITSDIVSAATFTNPSTGPLGPFTGYATILKSSKFLKPAQQLLDEFCSVPGSKAVTTSEVPERISGKVSMFEDAFDMSDHQALVTSKGCGSSSAASSSTLYSSNNLSAGECIVRDRPRDSCQPEYQQKKARLVYMHEEVCRRYKQYHQQMQMVVLSFESVAGLSAATPYVSLALKSVMRHFRCLRSTISDQLRNVRKAMGEDFMFPTIGTSSSKGDTDAARQRYEQNFQKYKSIGDNAGFVEPQQHNWRPQRGLPERSVAILRTWLFEHFLHPYPTDTDKHMLATQTGLSRNQVSNWFINARVRVWKPMVEEIHMLETNGLAQTNNKQGNHINEGTSCSNGGEEPVNKHTLAGMGSSTDMSCEQWSQEKRSRVECQMPPNIGGGGSFTPYQRSGLEMGGGLGSVSLTLGLRHTAQHQQQYLKQHEDQLQRQFGGHMFHDFVG